ncbi:MAG: phosphate transporter phosphate-binding protein [Gemmatimonadota bacterium]|jgi:phosphate transport system substrate-binding protein
MDRPPYRRVPWLRTLAILWIGVLAGFALGVQWWRARPAPPPPPSGGIDLVGAGATFPYPLYRRWFEEYGAASGVRINYFSVGSGDGIALLLSGGADFGAADRPLDDAERRLARCGPLEIPTVAGAVAIVTNLPGVSDTLRVDAAVLADLFGGRITRWDDPRLTALNPATPLPGIPVRVVRRGDASGTGHLVDAYLADVPAWRALAGDWPVGEVMSGNEGVAAQVRASPGAIGFVELSYARQARLAVAAVRNVAGRFVAPDSLSVATTAAELLGAPAQDARSILVGARNPSAYPIVGVTRIIADQVLGDARRAAHLLAFARWSVEEGARSATALGYVPLPAGVVRRVVTRLDGVTPGVCPGAGAD